MSNVRVSLTSKKTSRLVGNVIAILGPILILAGLLTYLQGPVTTSGAFTSPMGTFPIYDYTRTYLGLQEIGLGGALLIASVFFGNPLSRFLRLVYGGTFFKSLKEVRGEVEFEMRGKRIARLLLSITGAALLMNVVAVGFYANLFAADVPPPAREWAVDLWLRIGLVFVTISLAVVGVLALAYFLGGMISDALNWTVYAKLRKRYDERLFVLEDRYLWKFLTRPIPLVILASSAIIAVLGLPNIGAVGTIQAIVSPLMVLTGVGLYLSLSRASKELGIKLSRSLALAQLSASSEVIAMFWEIVLFGVLLVNVVPEAVATGYAISINNLPTGLPSPTADPAFIRILSSGAIEVVHQFRGVVFSVVGLFLVGIALYLYVIPVLLEPSPTRLKLYRLALPAVAFVASFLSEEALLALSGQQVDVSPFALSSAILISMVATLLGTSYERVIESSEGFATQ